MTTQTMTMNLKVKADVDIKAQLLIVLMAVLHGLGIGIRYTGITIRLIANRLRPVILAITGLTLLTAAAFTLNFTLGLAVAGLACWALEWRMSRD